MRTVIYAIQPGTSSSQLVAQRRVDLFEVVGTHPAERNSALIGHHDHQDPQPIQKCHCVGGTLEQFELVHRLDVVAWRRRAVEDPIAVQKNCGRRQALAPVWLEERNVGSPGGKPEWDLSQIGESGPYRGLAVDRRHHQEEARRASAQ